MDNPAETAWFNLDQLTQHDAMASDDAFLQIHDMDYGFTLSDFDADFDLYTQATQFPPSVPLTPLDSQPLPRAKSRVSLACIPCRSRHTRCDATAPVCTQCSASGRACSYAQSRRGRGKLAVLEQRHQPSRCEEAIDLERQHLNLQPRSAASHEASSVSLGQSPVSLSSGLSAVSRRNGTVPRSVPELDDPSKLIEIYYASFYDAHPFVLPHQFLTQRLQTNSASLQHLLPVMEFIGSLFAQGATKEVLRARAESALLRDDLPGTGFTVQALLIFAIAVHSCNEFVYARGILDRAARIALEINMQSKSFATANGEGCVVLEESWRRTWWYLYVTDGIFAGIRHCLTFPLYEIDADVDLPCEEVNYQTGEIPLPRTLEEYNSREFAGEELHFSSFTYLIDLGHILGAVLALGIELRELFEPDVISADASLMNWSMYLPKRKQLVDEDLGTVDEILFQAHMLCNTLKIYLHRPRSQLSYNLIEHTSQCAPPPSSPRLAAQQRAHAFHTAKTLEAADAALALLTLPGPFTAHSPLVICGLALAMLAQLAACRFKLRGPGYAAARERVRLGLGKVGELGGVWEVGRVTVREVRGVAWEVLELRGEEGRVRSGGEGVGARGVEVS